MLTSDRKRAYRRVHVAMRPRPILVAYACAGPGRGAHPRVGAFAVKGGVVHG